MTGLTLPAAISSLSVSTSAALHRLPPEHQAHPLVGEQPQTAVPTTVRRGSARRPAERHVHAVRPSARRTREDRVVRVGIEDPVVLLARARVVDLLCSRARDRRRASARSRPWRCCRRRSPPRPSTSRSGRRTDRHCPMRRRSAPCRRACTVRPLRRRSPCSARIDECGRVAASSKIIPAGIADHQRDCTGRRARVEPGARAADAHDRSPERAAASAAGRVRLDQSAEYFTLAAGVKP